MKVEYIVEQKIGDRVIKGQCLRDANGAYSYDYPYCRQLAKGISYADRKFIAERTGLDILYINRIMAGERFNAQVIQLAEQLAEINALKHQIQIQQLDLSPVEV
jgi:hypothetical protein